MFAVIRTQPCVPEKWTGRLLDFFYNARGIRLEPVVRCGVRILECVIDLPSQFRENKALRRINIAMTGIAETGIRNVIPSVDFAYAELLAQHHLTLPNRGRLLRRIAGKMAVRALGKDAAFKTVSLHANRLSPEFDETVRMLLSRTRNLVILCGARRDEYTGGLMREFGISVLTNKAALERADVHILFDYCTEEFVPKAESTAIILSPIAQSFDCQIVRDAELEWPERLEKIPDYPLQEMITALFECGAVNAEEIQVKSLL